MAEPEVLCSVSTSVHAPRRTFAFRGSPTAPCARVSNLTIGRATVVCSWRIFSWRLEPAAVTTGTQFCHEANQRQLRNNQLSTLSKIYVVAVAISTAAWSVRNPLRGDVIGHVTPAAAVPMCSRRAMPCQHRDITPSKASSRSCDDVS